MHQHNNALHIPSIAFGRTSVLRFGVVALFALMMIDNVLTYAGVVYLNGIEANPLCAYLGLDAFIVLKVMLAFIIPAAIHKIGNAHMSASGLCCAVLVALYGAVAVNNVIRLGLVG